MAFHGGLELLMGHLTLDREGFYLYNLASPVYPVGKEGVV